MDTRALKVSSFVLAGCAFVIAGSAEAGAPKRFLSPAEAVEIVNKSDVTYNIATGMEGLEGVNPANTSGRLFPLSVPPDPKSDLLVRIVEPGNSTVATAAAPMGQADRQGRW